MFSLFVLFSGVCGGVWGVDLPIVMIEFSRDSRHVVVSLLTRVQYDSSASFVLGFQPLSEGAVLGLSSFVCWSSLVVVVVNVHITYQWSDFARFSSCGCWM